MPEKVMEGSIMDKLYEMFAKAVAGAALLFCILCIGSIIAAFPLKWAWNGVVPGVFGLKEIGFWEAFCLTWLSGILLKSSPKVG